MKPFRLVFIGTAAIVAILLVGAAVIFNGAFQTWAARRALASRPDLHATIGSVAAGLGRVVVRDFHAAPSGLVFTVPQLEAELPVPSAALRKKVIVSRLVAKGWTLDLSKLAMDDDAPAATVPSTAIAASAASQAFAGLFPTLRLPVDLALDGVQLEGDVILPGAAGRAHVTITGGRLAAGSEAKFDLASHAALADPKVNALELHGTLTAAMDSPRTFTRFGLKLDAAASGAQFPAGVRLTADAAAQRDANGESYAAAVVEGERALLGVKAAFPSSASRLEGTWKLDLRDSDVVPFALGHALPEFTVAGEGRVEADASFAALRASGKIEMAANQLGALRRELSAIGPLKIVADFDLTQRSHALAIERFDAAIAGEKPVATVRSLQSFTLDFETRRLAAADPARELFGVVLQGLPLAWAGPFLPDLAIAGGDIRGELVATTRSDGLLVQARAPLTAGGISLARAGRPLLRDVDVTLAASADYAPQGWQTEVDRFTAQSGGKILFTLEGKAGRLAGAGQPLKATGKLAADLPALLVQPAAARALVLARGTATATFVASVLGGKRELQADLAVGDLAADPQPGAEKLPAISTNVRADIAADGRVTLHAPIALERDGRKSDLAIAGSIMSAKGRIAVDAQVTSTNFVVDDAKVLAALLPTGAGAAPERAPTNGPAAPTPPWAGVSGSIALALKKVVYSDSFQASDVSGTLRLEDGTLKFERLQAGVGDTGEAKLDGAVKFDPSAPQPYTLAADLAMKEFDPAPLLRAFNPKQPPPVEGKFNVASKLGGSARDLSELAANATGDFQLTSTGGVFRGLPVSVSKVTETTSRLASWMASAGNAIVALTGRKDGGDISSDAQAVAEIAKGLNPIAYDQLSVVVSRDATLSAVLKDFTLISPEIRLSGSGQTLHTPGKPVLDDTLAMEFKLRARGHYAELLKYVGALDLQPDELGYLGCNVPMKIGGTLGAPDASDASTRIASLALKKSGLTEKAMEKAGEWLAKLRPGK
ncbi:MAG TPA: AsmA family protein [Opitutaceae bacterium]|nr:AsmA family protein [Opitutaceae bacterium]